MLRIMAMVTVVTMMAVASFVFCCWRGAGVSSFAGV